MLVTGLRRPPPIFKIQANNAKPQQTADVLADRFGVSSIAALEIHIDRYIDTARNPCHHHSASIKREIFPHRESPLSRRH